MKIGDYVRTKDGKIGKILMLNSIYFAMDIDDNTYAHEFDEIIKSSPNIIDLIEVGDSVKYNPMMNGYIKKQTFCKMIKDTRDLLYFKYQIEHKKANLISILTKEQFERCEYKI